MSERTLYHEIHVALSFIEVKGKPFAVAGRLGFAIGVLLLDLEVRPHGIVLPQGSHVCMAVNTIQNSPDVTPEPEVFHRLLDYKLRQRERKITCINSRIRKTMY